MSSKSPTALDLVKQGISDDSPAIVARESGIREIDFGPLDDLNWNVPIPTDIDWSELRGVEY